MVRYRREYQDLATEISFLRCWKDVAVGFLSKKQEIDCLIRSYEAGLHKFRKEEEWEEGCKVIRGQIDRIYEGGEK